MWEVTTRVTFQGNTLDTSLLCGNPLLWYPVRIKTTGERFAVLRTGFKIQAVVTGLIYTPASLQHPLTPERKHCPKPLTVVVIKRSPHLCSHSSTCRRAMVAVDLQPRFTVLWSREDLHAALRVANNQPNDPARRNCEIAQLHSTRQDLSDHRQCPWLAGRRLLRKGPVAA
jgi:hypothetical protein